ncbi:MAG: ATP synthase F1 subunit gamma [Bacteroidales bacterium]|nr:ATP synthase F1 subunit gamma [Bacteroidales bacterium]
MASLREIKDHIGSVRSTLKITSAMKLVSSAKLRKAQQAVETMRPYQQELERMLAAVNSLNDNSLQNVLSADSGKGLSVKSWESDTYLLHGKLAIVAIASNSSLCGAFNGNVVRKVQELVAQAGGPDRVEVFALGRKVAEPLRKSGVIADPDRQSLNALVAHPDYAASQALASILVDGFNAGRYSSVLLVYNHFVSTSSQKVVVESFLGATVEPSGWGSPLEGRNTRGFTPEIKVFPGAPGSVAGGPSPEGDGGVSPKDELPRGGFPNRPAPGDYLLEPGREAILESLEPQVIRLKLYAAILDSVAAEHAARMIAMQAATDNAEDLLAELSLEYNKGRQAKITAEILDLVAGARQ